MGIQVLETGCLTKAKELLMDETIINGVEFVDVVYHLASSITHEFLNEYVSAKGNTQAN